MMNRPKLSEYDDIREYCLKLDLYCDEIERNSKKLYQIIDRAIDYMHTYLEISVQDGDEITRMTKEDIREWLWDDEEWRNEK